jgi:hypothetical protein
MPSQEQKTLLNLVHISNKFNRAVADAYGKDADKAQKLRSAFTAFDMRDIADLQQSSHTKIMDVFRRGGTQEEAEEAVAPDLIRMTDIFAKAVLTFETEDNLRALMPAEAQNDRTAKAFRKHNAPVLAKLCQTN